MKQLEQLDHPNIVKYIESYENEKTMYIVMEYFDGKQLYDMITEKVENNGTFTENEVSKIIKIILGAIQYCHSQNIMHDDIKPKKILVDKEGGIKLVDFGLSKWDFLSKLQLMSGTAFYIAPEVLKNIKSAKSDIWSIGVVMYTLLSGKLPFVSDTNETLFNKAIKGDLSFKSSVWESVSNEARELIQRMLNTDIKKRFSAEECLDHEWFDMEHTETENDKFSVSIRKNLKLMRSQTIMQSAAQKFVKKEIEIKDIKGMKEKFYELSDEKGTVNIVNFKQILLKTQIDFTGVQADNLIKEILQSQESTERIDYINFINELK